MIGSQQQGVWQRARLELHPLSDDDGQKHRRKPYFAAAAAAV